MRATLTGIRTQSLRAPGLALLFLALATSSTLADALRYTITNLGTLPGASDARAYGLNDVGQVVGQSGGATFVYSSGTGMTSLGISQPPAGITDSGAVVYNPNGFNALGINGSGELAGEWSVNFNPASASTALNGVVTPIPGLSPGAAQASAINDAGQVVGIVNGVNPATGLVEQHPFLFSDGKVTDLGPPPGSTSAYANGINNSGQIIVSSWDATGHAFLYSGGKMIDLGTLGGPQSSAMFINNNGLILGGSSTSDGRSDFFLYQGGKMTDLTDLINASGGLDISNIVGLNDAGQILINNISTAGEYQTYLLTPATVPEPATLAIMISGGAALIANRLRRTAPRKSPPIS